MIPDCEHCGLPHTTKTCPNAHAMDALIDPFRDAPPADPKAAAVERLSQAACNLRDAELARIAAQKAYGEALDAFNRCVAPVG